MPKEESQEQSQDQSQDKTRPRLTLYHSPTCMFCIRVWQAIKQFGLSIEGKDISRDPAARQELVNGGGRGMVPCLLIEEGGSRRWLYESADIISYLREQA